MRVLIIFSVSLVMSWASPLLKSKEVYGKIKNRIFGVNTDCGPCGGIHTVQPMGIAPMPNVYVEAYNPSLQLHGESGAASSAGNVYNSQEYAPGSMHHFMNANGVRTHNFKSDKRPAPALNYANNHYAQVENAAAASTAVSHSSSTLWEHEENAQAASRAQQMTVTHGGGVDTFGAVPPVPAGPVWFEGDQYNAYSPLGAAATAQSASSAWSQQNRNYGQNNGRGVAFAHASSTSWSSNNSG